MRYFTWIILIYLVPYISRTPYESIYGGGILMTPAQMEATNGFSNDFYGWGGEDDNIYKR